jgi:pyrroloquinoline quinone (PQQ) biosynthesis protein C
MNSLIDDLKAHRNLYIDSNPIFARLAGGEITLFHYLAYLRETYHLIKHTPEYLTIAAGRVADGNRQLAAYFQNFAQEETGHEWLCIRDIQALGADADVILSGGANPGVWGIVTQCYFWASQGNPLALLGDAFATEELGATSGLETVKTLEMGYGIPRQATNFLRVHGSEDGQHLEAAARVIESYAGNPDDYREIAHAVKMTYRYYGQLFTDVLELGDIWGKQKSLSVRGKLGE